MDGAEEWQENLREFRVFNGCTLRPPLTLQSFFFFHFPPSVAVSLPFFLDRNNLRRRRRGTQSGRALFSAAAV